LGADAIYLDGFAPERNPALWEAPLLKAVARLARPGATLATYTAARAVREALAAGGFEVLLQPGFGRKRHMLAARYAPRWRVRRHEPPAAYDGERNALVIGAGLAGAHCADALARRGWQVTVVDA
ncbi:MAG: MnmC family methyltransferase, partial [Burkholderiaceae bacterium]|nr:MnmC family methyltransferase [Burkholderiaceae bacterium]